MALCFFALAIFLFLSLDSDFYASSVSAASKNDGVEVCLVSYFYFSVKELIVYLYVFMYEPLSIVDCFVDFGI